MSSYRLTVDIKPLEWEDADNGMCTKWRAEALGGHYDLVALDGDEGGLAVNFYWGMPLSFWFIQGGPNEWGPTGPKIFPTLEEAKAAAQSDYESRIRSALSHQPAPVAANASAEPALNWQLSDDAKARIAEIDDNRRNAALNASNIVAGSSNASAEARLREALEKTSRALEEIKAVVWGECPSLLNEDSGGNARLDMDIDDALEAAKQALSAHSPASDCDKQGCMGDQSPSDPKDLKELLSTPSVLEPSDRTASDCEKQGERTAPLSCPDCHDESDCSHVAICRAVEEVYSPSDRTADVTEEELASIYGRTLAGTLTRNYKMQRR